VFVEGANESIWSTEFAMTKTYARKRIANSVGENEMVVVIAAATVTRRIKQPLVKKSTH